MVAANPNLTVEERRERKRLQNRLNQRARSKIARSPQAVFPTQRNAGQRNKHEESINTKPRQHPYRVHRWRVIEDASLSDHSPIPIAPGPAYHTNNGCPPDDGIGQSRPPQPMRTHQIPKQASVSVSSRPTCGIKFPLPTDHVLIHLITQNVSRGLMSNKSILRLSASFIHPVNNLLLPPDILTPCEIAVVRPTHQAIPHCLQPTQLQMNSPHPSWIDVLPFPDMRDSLIRQQSYFNHIHFLEDLVGDLVHSMPLSLAKERGLALPNPRSCAQQDDAQISPDGKGMVLWGEAYLKESWEVTPRFLRKWSWAAGGCDELVKISNRWRTARGEGLLEVSLLAGSSGDGV